MNGHTEIYRGQDRSMAPVFDKAEVTLRRKHKWHDLPEPGTFMWIEITELALDLSYQRPVVSRTKVNRIARNFDWQAFGALSVVMRKDGFFVTDGGHRFRAAEMRDDVEKVPCMVFNAEGVEDEAQAFLTQNTMTTAVTPYHKFRAMLVAKDEIALKVKDALDKHGYRAASSGTAQHSTGAIAAMLEAARQDLAAFRVTLDLCVDIAAGEPIPASVFRGLNYLIVNGCQEIATTTYRKKLVYLGMDVLVQSITRNKHMFGQGGKVMEARSLIEAVNKGRRTNLLKLPVK